MISISTEKREQFNKVGYYVFENIIEPKLLVQLRESTVHTILLLLNFIHMHLIP